MFSAYLWGIETYSQQLSRRQSVQVLSLPMRNWNRRSWSCIATPGEFSAYLWGIETTISQYINVIFACSQPTYEELKQFNPVQFIFRSVRVLSLPMRNWNTLFMPSLFIPTPSFSAYLWGIETREATASAIASRASFSAYLWGIETWCAQLYCAGGHLRSQPTYEELKRFAPVPGITP